MGKKENFDKALNSLFAIGKDAQEEAKRKDPPAAEHLEPAQERAGEPLEEFGYEPLSGQTTVISAGTVVEGNIHSAGNVEISGQLKGDLEAKGGITVHGSVHGTITGSGTIEMFCCEVKGDVNSDQQVVLGNGGRVTGNLFAGDLICDGTVEGNLTVKRKIVLKKNSVVVGDMKASSLSVEEGVSLQGTVEVLAKQEQR